MNRIEEVDLPSVQTRQTEVSDLTSDFLHLPCHPSFVHQTHSRDPESGPLLDRSIMYPLQAGPYSSPSPFLSIESKRIIRQAQDPLYASAPRVSHFLYEVTINHYQYSYCFQLSLITCLTSASICR